MRKLMIALALTTFAWAGSAAAADTPPKNTGPPTISGTAQLGQKLTADPGVWSGTQPLTFTYQWRRCSQKGTSCSNIVGATTKTLSLTSVDVDNTIRVRVRAANTTGASVAVSAPTVVVTGPKSVTLDSSQSSAVYGRRVILTGTVENGRPGESVTITEHRFPAVGGIDTHALATVKTASDGSFRFAVRPLVRSLYRATAGQVTSNDVVVRAHPLLRLRHLGPNRFLVRAVAARSFVGRFGVLQRWSVLRQHWVGVRRVLFRRAVDEITPTMTSSAVFRTRLAVRIRVVMPRRQTRPGYIAGFSNSVRG
jgi:hypothetical protein